MRGKRGEKSIIKEKKRIYDERVLLHLGNDFLVGLIFSLLWILENRNDDDGDDSISTTGRSSFSSSSPLCCFHFIAVFISSVQMILETVLIVSFICNTLLC